MSDPPCILASYPHAAELHDRIRELEAELALSNSKIQAMLELPPELRYRARAEKAERELELTKKYVLEQVLEREKVEARVAELGRVYRKYVEGDDSGLPDMFEHVAEGHSHFFASCVLCVESREWEASE